MRTIVISFLLLAPPLQAQTILKPGQREVRLDPDARVHQEQVRGAPFVLTALVLPESYTQATCGNCTNKQGETPENWFMDLAPADNTIYLKPTRLPDAQHPPAAFATTLHITLASGYRISINLALADIRGTKPPDAEVAFTMPDKATLSGRLAEEKAKLEAQFQERLDQQTMQLLTKTLLGDPACDKPWGKPYRAEPRLYVRLKHGCSIRGERDTYWVVFNVTNSDKAPLDLAQAVLSPANDVPDAQRGFGFASSSLRHDQSTLGVAFAVLPPGSTRPSSWQLTISEAGGYQRVVTISDIALDS